MKKKNTSKFGRAGKVPVQFVTGFCDALILPFKDHFTCFSLIEIEQAVEAFSTFNQGETGKVIFEWEN
jgi:hypothetical protein